MLEYMVGFLKTCEILTVLFIFVQGVSFSKTGTAVLNSCLLLWGFKEDTSIILLFI